MPGTPAASWLRGGGSWDCWAAGLSGSRSGDARGLWNGDPNQRLDSPPGPEAEAAGVSELPAAPPTPATLWEEPAAAMEEKLLLALRNEARCRALRLAAPGVSGHSASSPRLGPLLPPVGVPLPLPLPCGAEVMEVQRGTVVLVFWHSSTSITCRAGMYRVQINRR